MQAKNKTIMTKKEEVKRNWFVLDATGKTLGRFASEITKILRGKHKPSFTPNIDCGDGVIVINAGKIAVTGAKEAQKSYDYYTGYMSGRREIPYRTLLARNPGYIVERAVKGMMPKTRLGKAQIKKLRIYADDKHGMDAQQPTTATI